MFDQPYERGYFIDENGGVYDFQFNPESIKDSSSAVWANHDIHGGSHPRIQYAGSKGRNLKFTLRFYGSNKNGMTCRQQVNWLRSCVYPDTSAGSIPHRAPPRVFMNLGRLYQGLLIVIRDVDITWSNHMTRDLEPIEASADLSVSEFTVPSVDYRQVRTGSR